MDQYRVFGNPIKHSKSPNIHRAFARSTQQELAYESQLVEMNGFKSAIESFVQAGGKGANVTVPFKEQALTLSDHLSERARLAGAVNTLSFREGVIYGDNTDGLGLVHDLVSQNVILKHSKILLLGAGGAAKGVILPLLAKNPKNIAIANRTVTKAVLSIGYSLNVLQLASLESKGFIPSNKYQVKRNVSESELMLQWQSVNYPVSDVVERYTLNSSGDIKQIDFLYAQ